MMPSKRKKRLAFVWSCLFLLQELNMVFLLNIEEMRKSPTRIPDVSDSSNKKMRSSDMHNVLEALRLFGNRLKDKNASIVERVKAWLVDCRSTDEMATYEFWTNNPTFGFIYGIISSALYYIAECHLQMEQRANEIIHRLDYNTTIQLISALTEFEDAASSLNDNVHHRNKSASTDQEPDDDVNVDPDVISLLKSNVLELLSINLFNAGELNGIFNALAHNFTIGNETELEDMLQYASEVSVTETLKDSILEDVAETENNGMTADSDAVLTKLKLAESELKLQKSHLDKNAVASTLDKLKSQLSQKNFRATEVKRNHTVDVPLETLKPSFMYVYQDLIKIDSPTDYFSRQTRKKRSEDSVQHYIMYISSNPCFVMTNSKEGKFSEFKSFAHLKEQEWRYDLKHLINSQSGLAVSVETFSRHFEKIMMLAEPDWDAESQSWDIDNENRLQNVGSKNCRLDIHNGYVSVYCDDSQPLIEIKLVPYLEYQRIHWQKECDSIDSSEFFFMKSSNSAHACKVLTVTDQKEQLTYQEVFDRDISWQLWRASNGHLVNMGSGLNLQITKSGLELFDLNRIITLGNATKSSVWYDSLHITLTQKETCELMKDSYKYDYEIGYTDSNDIEDKDNSDNITCQNTQEMNMTWTYITLESARNDLERISCFYIIFNANSPCEVMIVNGIQNNVSILATPEIEQLVHGAGLWYYSENHLIHAGTGLALTSELALPFSASGLTLQHRVDLDENQLWLLVGREISTLDAKLRLTIQSQTTSRYIGEWLVSERRAAIENDIRKGCDDQRPFQDIHEEQSQRYFIRNKVSTCKFLSGSGPGFPDLEYFATHKMEKYIWRIQKGYILHEDTRLVLSFINSESPHRTLISLGQPNSAGSSQEWIVNGTRILPKHSDSCEMGLFEPNSNVIGLFCNENIVAYKEWELMPVSEHTEAKDLICPFFLRNDDKNCFFMTHLDGSDSVFAMPMYPRVISLQLWYWDGNQIRDVVSGKYFSVSNSNVATLIGNNAETNNYIKNWEFKQYHLSPYNDSSMHVVTQPNGEIRLMERNEEETQKWSMLFQKDLEGNNSMLHCDNPDAREVFLITSNTFPCDVLTSVRADEQPVFIQFDESIIADQLWWWKEGALVNLGTRLHLGYNNSDHSAEIVMVQSDSSNRGIFQVEFRSKSFFVQRGLDSFKLKATLNSDGHRTISLGNDYVGDISTENTFEILNLNDIQDNMERIVCTFFIRNNLYPCQYLTGKGNMGRVMVEPLTHEMIEDQVWFWQGMKLIHARTGLVLTKSELDRYLVLRSDANTTWITSTSNTVQEGGLDSGHMWEADPLSDGAVKLESSSYLPSQQWSFLRTEESLANPELLECPSKGSGMKQLYFLRALSYPCLLLTATKAGEYPKFEHLDTGSVETQLWYKDDNNIINVGSGLAIKVFSKYRVGLSHRNAFKMDQKWVARDDRILSQNDQGFCLEYIHNGDPLQQHPCGDERVLSQRWEWVPMENIQNVSCFYFIRNELQPCEFLTGSIEHIQVSVKPLVPELMENQIWYWNATRLVHQKTGFELTVQDGSIVLQSSEGTSSARHWEIDYGYGSIHVLNDLNVLTMNPENNGLLFISGYPLGYMPSMSQRWKFYEVESSIKNVDKLFCPVEQSVTNELFFILSDDVPCHVLTATRKGQPPEFTRYSEETISHQLWYMNGESIVNSATFLALDIDYTMRSQVILNDFSAFVKSQKWFKEDHFIVSRANTKCVLDVIRGNPRIPISYCRKHGNRNQRWSFVPFDSSFSNFEKIVCLQFIQSRVAPCELLTGFGKDEIVRTRPLSQDFISSQLWFWSGDKLINAHTGLALDMEHKGWGAKIILREKGDFETQNWVRDQFIVKSRANNFALDLDKSNGAVITWGKVHGHSNQLWYFVNKDDGLRNIDSLHCTTAGESHAYFLKSEDHPCPLLTFDGHNTITRQQLDTAEPSKQLWLMTEKNIVNVKAGKALSLRDRFYDGAPVVLETRYAFEPYQQWEWSNGQIKTLFKDQSKVLDFFQDALRIYHKDGSNTQIWTWLSLKNVNNNQKLLRCAHCYDSSEEQAADIIGYIPIFSTLYNLIRAAVYAGKKCYDVALEALYSAVIDLGVDLIIALSAGMASAAAYGIKVGVKFGIKAGLKAMATSIKASVKVSVKAIQVSFKQALQKGLVGTIKQQLKVSIMSAKNTLKSSFRFLKNIPTAAKTVLTQSSKQLHFALRSVKAVSTSLKTNFKRLNMIRKTQGFKTFASSLALSASKTGKSIRSSISQKLADIGKSIKSKLNEIVNSLADRAEKNIQLANTDVNDLKRLTRCKRMLGLCGIRIGRGSSKRRKAIARSNDDVKYLQVNVDMNAFQGSAVVREDMIKMKKFTRLPENYGGQYAVVGLRNPATREIDDVAFVSVNDIRKAEPRPVPLGPGMKPADPPGANVRPDAHVQHAEQFLLENKLNIEQLEKCRTSKHLCEIFLYTKYSPCISHGNAEALSCVDYLMSKCTELSKQYNTKCIVGFDKWWGDSSPWLDDVEVKKALSGDDVARKNLRAMGLSDDTFDSIDTFLLNNGNNQDNVRKIILDISKDNGENRFYSIYKTEFGKKNVALSDLERKQLTTTWEDVFNLPDEFTDIRDLKENIQEFFITKFGKALKKTELEAAEKCMQSVNNFLKANPSFDVKTLQMELIRNFQDKTLQKKLNDWSKVVKVQDLDSFRTSIESLIHAHFESVRLLKTEYSLKSFSIFLDETFGDAARKVLREELATRKTIDYLQKATSGNTFVEFVLLT